MYSGFLAIISNLFIDFTALFCLLLFLIYTIAIAALTVSNRTAQAGTSMLRRIVMRFLFSVGVGGCEGSVPKVEVKHNFTIIHLFCFGTELLYSFLSFSF